MKRRLNALLIGTGMVAGTHVAALADARNARLFGVLGRDIEKTKAFAKKATAQVRNPVHAYSNLSDALATKEVDFAIVATPPNARHAIAGQLVANSTPILLEKPIERTADAARAIVEMCKSAHVPLGVVFQHRARVASQALKTVLDEERLGTICAAEVRVPWWRPQSYYDEPGRGTYDRDGGGVMINQAIHTLDILLWLLGPISRLQAQMQRTKLHDLQAEDWATALFETQAGCVGSLMATTSAHPGQTESIALFGTKGSAHLAAGQAHLCFLTGDTQTFGDEASTGGGSDPMAFTHAWHQTIIENFADCVLGHGPQLASGESALRAHAVIAAMEAANRAARWTEVETE
ncbi:MAG: Gfo/Idh/MocA family oxidoreductase [Pseudomonadota bacterium]